MKRFLVGILAILMIMSMAFAISAEEMSTDAPMAEAETPTEDAEAPEGTVEGAEEEPSTVGVNEAAEGGQTPIEDTEISIGETEKEESGAEDTAPPPTGDGKWSFPDIELPFDIDAITAYVREEIGPMILSFVTLVTAIYLAISPVLKGIKKASEKFKSATEDVNAATQGTAENREEIAGMIDRMDIIISEFEAIKKTGEDTQEIVRLGFGNTKELVVNGYANEIAKVGKTNEQLGVAKRVSVLKKKGGDKNEG